jgi:hypothetical protein
MIPIEITMMATPVMVKRIFFDIKLAFVIQSVESVLQSGDFTINPRDVNKDGTPKYD